MSSKRFKEIKNLSKDELATKIRETEAEIFTARMQRATGQLKNTSSIWKMRKDLARMKMLAGKPAAVAKAPVADAVVAKAAKAKKAPAKNQEKR
jgi:large subunit ribosomal protein L29